MIQTHNPAPYRSVLRNDVAGYLQQILFEEMDVPADIKTALQPIFTHVLANPEELENGRNLQDAQALAAHHTRQEQSYATLDALCDAAILQFKNDDEKLNLLSSTYARFSQLFNMAGFLARENFFDHARQIRDKALAEGGPIPQADLPGFIERMLYEWKAETGEGAYTEGSHRYYFRTMDEFLSYLAKPKLEITLTAHPTFTGSLEVRRLLRTIHDAAQHLARSTTPEEAGAAEREMRTHMKAMLQVAPTPSLPDGGIRNYTHREEIETELMVLENTFAEIPEIYGTFDRSIRARFKGEYDLDAQINLRLNIRFNSWITGDKDGNQNMKAEHLLLSSVLRNQRLLHAYQVELASLEGRDINPWKARIDSAQKGLATINAALLKAEETSPAGDLVLTRPELERLTHDFATALSILDNGITGGLKGAGNAFEATIEKKLRANPNNKTLLNLLRRVRSFGFVGVHPELRETADEFTRVIDTLCKIDPDTGLISSTIGPVRVGDATYNLADYAGYSPDMRTAIIGQILTKEPDFFQKRATAFLQKIDSTDALRSYSHDDPRVITYHSLQRMKICVATRGAAEDIQLAECGGAHHMLEALALQRAVSPTLRLHIAPLLEEHDTLASAVTIIEKALNNKAVRQHLLALAGGDPSKITFKFQLAHSDNTRRDGIVSSKSSIHKTIHDVEYWVANNQDKIAAAFAEDGVDGAKFYLQVEWFQGGSMGHILRNGGRSATAMVNSFSSYLLALRKKIAESTSRVFDYAECLYFKITMQGEDFVNFFTYGPANKRFMARFFSHAAKELAYAENVGTNGHEKDWPVDAAVIAAFQDCRFAYQQDHFNETPNPRGHLYAHSIVNYAVYGATSNRTTRAAIRGKAVNNVDMHGGKTEAVAVTRIRSIGDVEAQAIADLQLTWAGAKDYLGALTNHILESDAARDDLQRRTNRQYSSTTPIVKNGEITPEAMHTLYRTSRVYREIADFVAMGFVSSFPHHLQKRLARAEDRFGIGVHPKIQKYITQTLPTDALPAAHFIMGSFLGQEPVTPHNAAPNIQTIAALRHEIEQRSLHNISAIVETKTRLAHLPKRLRDFVLARAEKNQTPLTRTQWQIVSNAEHARMVDTHGRYAEIDDPHFMRALRSWTRQRPQRQAITATPV